MVKFWTVMVTVAEAHAYEHMTYLFILEQTSWFYGKKLNT